MIIIIRIIISLFCYFLIIILIQTHFFLTKLFPLKITSNFENSSDPYIPFSKKADLIRAKFDFCIPKTAASEIDLQISVL